MSSEAGHLHPEMQLQWEGGRKHHRCVVVLPVRTLPRTPSPGLGLSEGERKPRGEWGLHAGPPEALSPQRHLVVTRGQTPQI